MDFYQQIKEFGAETPQERGDKEFILSFCNHFPDTVLYRQNIFAHVTSSGFVLNEDLSKMLMVHHNIYKTWAWTGGHADGNSSLLDVAMKESCEETGIVNVAPLTDKILSLDVLNVCGHFKNGIYVSAHLHLSAAYVLIGNENDQLKKKEDENSGVRWVNVEDIEGFSNEPEIVPIYFKLIERAKTIKSGRNQ